MNLTEFGGAVRKARIDARVTLRMMADELEVTPAFLSGLEVGRKKIPSEWVQRIEKYFRGRGIELPSLQSLADIANESVSLKGLSPDKQMFIAGFARKNLSDEQIKRFMSLLSEQSKEA